MPLANRLIRADQLAETEPRYPLILAFCPTCALVQITETVPPDELFLEYSYFSAFSDTMLQSSEAIVERLIEDRHLGSDSLAMEVGSNDGYLLQYYRRAGVPVLGIDPAENVARVAETERGVPTIAEMFGTALAERLVAEGRLADVVHANNVLAHVPDVNGVVRGISLVLKDSGVAVIETPSVREMVERAEFDTIYHEHVFCYSVTSLRTLFGRHGLTIQDVEEIPIHGGSFRLFVGKSTEQSERVGELLREEQALGMDQRHYYDRLRLGAERVRQSLRGLLGDLRRDGRTIAAYGAAAKGTMLLSYCEIGADTLEYVVDRSTYKQGLFLPGAHLPIFAPERLLETQPDYVLILPWNLADEIVAQQAEYRRRGGRFIVPIPEPRILDG